MISQVAPNRSLAVDPMHRALMVWQLPTLYNVKVQTGFLVEMVGIEPTVTKSEDLQSPAIPLRRHLQKLYTV